MLGAAVKKSHEDVQPLLIANLLNEPETIKEEIQTTYSIASTKNKEEDVVGGAGETVTKKINRKLTNDEKILRKTLPAICDKTPKKLAQRAKGTTSINKPSTILNSDMETKTKPNYSDKVSLKSEKSRDDTVCKLKSKSENQKNIAGEAPEKKFKSKLKKPTTKIPKKDSETTSPMSESIAEKEICETQINESVLAEDFKTETPAPTPTPTPSPTQSPNPSPVPIPSANPNPNPCATPIPNPEQPLKEEKDRIKSGSTTTTTNYNSGINCSLLERLQLGVKSYFTSRNSIICSDKNKKEGGNQTRARVGTEVKEDAQKTDPGFEFKNYLSILESGSLPDQLRLNSNLGGESNNFLTDNTQISQNLKRRKLKNNVRIQIPRKGYFYRSSALSKAPEQPLPTQPEWLDSQLVHKNARKTEIPGLAPTGAQVSGVPIKKGNLRSRKPFAEADVDADADSDEASTGSSWSGCSNLSVSRLVDVIEANGNVGKRRTGKNPSLSEMGEFTCFDKCLGFDVEKIIKKPATAIGGDFFDNSETGSKKPTTFKTLTTCITSVLKDDQLFKDLEITPANSEKGRFGSFSEETTKPLITPVPISCIPSTSTLENINPTTVLMGDIDLHTELQNYLKAFNSFSISKTRTKSTLNSNNLIKASEGEFLRIDQELENEKRSPFPVSDSTKYNFFDELEEERIESRLPRSQTEIPEIFKPILRKNSTMKALKKAYRSNNSIDDYEKIIPLGSRSSGRFKNFPVFFGEPVPDGLQTSILPDAQAQAQAQAQSKVEHVTKSPRNLELQDKVEIFYHVLQEYRNDKWRPKKPLVDLLSYLIPLLEETASNKSKKKNLINFAKEISERRGWKNFKEKESVKLNMYVNMFQKIIKALPVGQIIHLNNIISAWEADSEKLIKNYKIYGKTKAGCKRKNNEKASTSKETLSSRKSISSAFLSKGRKKPSKNLQTTLESFLNLENAEDYSNLSALKGKLLVDVKLSGNQIQVKNLSCFNDGIMARKKTSLDGRSELIIENVKQFHLKDIIKENKKPSVNKQVKKSTISKGKVSKKRVNEKPENVFPQTSHHESQLRTEHPIESILECSEAPNADKSPLSLYTESIESQIFKNDFGNTLLFDDFVKPKEPIQLEELTDALRLDRKLPPSRKASALPKAAKSMDEIGMAEPKKAQKAPSKWSRSFYCYSSLHIPQNKLFKEGNKGRKVQKKMKKQRPSPGGGASKPAFKSDASSDVYNFELLFSDARPKRRHRQHRQYQSQSISNLILGDVAEVAVDDEKMATASRNSNQSIGKKSFSLDLVHSDSFLKQYSNVSVLERDTKLLFQSDSYTKFRPKNWLDCKNNSKALTTFLLTPEEYEKSDLPNDDVVVVLRKKLPMTFQESQQAHEDGSTPCEGYDSETMRKKEKYKPEGKKFFTPSYKERKTKTRCQTCQFLSRQVSPSPKSVKTNTGPFAKSKKPTCNVAQFEKSSKKPPEVQQPKKKNVKEKVKKTAEEEVPGNVSKISVDVEDMTLEMMEALRKIFSKKDVLKNKKLASAIEKKKQIRKKYLDPKTVRSFTLKIHTKNPKKKEQNVNPSKPANRRANPPKSKNRIGPSKKPGKTSKGKECSLPDTAEKFLRVDLQEQKKGLKRANEPKTPAAELSEEKSEISLTHVSECLVEGQILDSFLQKKGLCSVNKALALIDENTENLITSLERSTWQVLMILDAVTQLVEKTSHEKLKEYLQSTKDIVNKILVLHVNRLANYQKLSPVPEMNVEGNAEGDESSFEVIRECFNNLREMFALKETAAETEKDNHVAVCENPNESDICAVSSRKSNESVLLEIRKIRNKVVNELNALEELFLIPEGGPVSEPEEKAAEEGRSGSQVAPSEDWLHRTYGCMQLMQCLLKVWDTRMSLNTYPSGCLQ